MQKFSSKNTSVNTKQLPAVYSRIDFGKLPKQFSVLDWGCGRDTNHIQALLQKHAVSDYIKYDPNWCTAEQNICAELCVGSATVFVSSNVLNVIDSDEVVRDICDKAAKHPIYFITVYEGDKSGIGKQSKEDCYQRNAKVRDYLKFLPDKQIFGAATVKKGVITNRPDLIK